MTISRIRPWEKVANSGRQDYPEEESNKVETQEKSKASQLLVPETSNHPPDLFVFYFNHMSFTECLCSTLELFLLYYFIFYFYAIL